MADTAVASPMPLCAAFAQDIRAAFGQDWTRVEFGTRLVYASEGNREWGIKGPQGVAVQ